MRALISKDYKAPYTEGEAITDGIDITTWCPTDSLTYSVWDFAGQTVYYNTHQVQQFVCVCVCVCVHAHKDHIIAKHILSFHTMCLIFEIFCNPFNASIEVITSLIIYFISVLYVTTCCVYSCLEYTAWLSAFWFGVLDEFYCLSLSRLSSLCGGHTC